MQKLKHLDLFSGIGGFSLGMERTGGFETVAFCEIDDWKRRVLAKHWPGVVIYKDIKKIVHGGDVDIITGGFPCQPFSTASHGVLTAIDLWPYMRTTIDTYKPKFAVAENVSEKAINQAASDLKEIGYECKITRISAADCGAPHRRNRWWLVAHADKNRELHRAIDAEARKLPQLCEGLWEWENYRTAVRISNGIPAGIYDNRRRVMAYGDAVLPQIPEALGNAILKAA